MAGRREGVLQRWIAEREKEKTISLQGTIEN
jgi:hypothetical protein